MRQKQLFFFLLLILTLSFSCKEKNKLNIDVSNIDYEVKIKRYETALFNLDENDLKSELKKIQDEYRFFLDANLDDTINIIQMTDYLKDPMILDIYQDCMEKYPDLNDIEEDLSMAYKHYKYYFSNRKNHTVYSYVSGLNYEAPVKYIDSVLVIALDMYLGKDYKQYALVRIPAYKAKWLIKESIVVDCMKLLAEMEINTSKKDENLLDNIIFQGKILYFVDAMLPEMHDSIKIKYSTDQIEWCKTNEANMWRFFVSNELLFSTEHTVINDFILDAPFTSKFSKESPSRIGCWIGWQIVKKYMKRNEVSLNDLLREKDSQKILRKSKYKP